MDSLVAIAYGDRADIKRLMDMEKTFISLAAQFKLDAKSAPERTYIDLLAASPQFVRDVTERLGAIIDVFVTCATEDINPWNDKDFFRVSMRRMNLGFAPDFLDYVTEGDVVEGYDMNRMQVFRNLAFMQQSGYSLLELLSYEWPTLFDRAAAITQKMTTFCDEILWSANRTIPFTIPKHFTRERQSAERIMFEVNFRYLSPIFSGPERPFGILGSYLVRTVEATDPADKLSFV